ncbi:MAG TPA: RNA ligase family protein [Spirochaetia bacterium]|nr:RNA ligase family protein [Spirochaetia bacterium]
MERTSDKPLGTKTYGHIPHLPGSRLGPGDHKVTPGQARICLEKARGRHDRIVVQEKVDGSNCAACKLGGVIIPLVRAGYWAKSSRYMQHHLFANWVYANYIRFDTLLAEGERLVGEWLARPTGPGMLYSMSLSWPLT